MGCYSGVEKYAFVSYSHRDAGMVTAVIDRLSSYGARIWYDEGLTPSDEYLEVIAEKILKSEFFIAFISAETMKSRFCRDEIRYAYERGKNILTVFLEDVELSAGFDMMLGGSQHCHIRELKAEAVDLIARKLPREVMNDGGRILRVTDKYTYFFAPLKDGCGYTVSRVHRSTGKSELLVKEGFPHCSEYVIDNVSTKRHFGNNFTLTVTVTWDFTYTRSGRDDEYFDETYEYVFFNLDSAENCGYRKTTLERYDRNTGETVEYDYVKGVDTHTGSDGKVTLISGLDTFGNYWNVRGKNGSN